VNRVYGSLHNIKPHPEPHFFKLSRGWKFLEKLTRVLVGVYNRRTGRWLLLWWMKEPNSSVFRFFSFSTQPGLPF